MTDTRQAMMNLDGQLEAMQDASSVQWVWVPTEQVLFLDALVPGKRTADWMQALPYVLEERLAQPVETLHFAVLHRENSGERAGWTQVAVVEKDRMRRWLDELEANGLANAALVPDCFRLPAQGETLDLTENAQAWLIWQDERQSRRLVRNGVYSGLAGEAAWLEQVWALAREQQPDLQQETLSSLPEPDWASLKPFSLRQGEFRMASDSGRVWQTWKWPMVLLVAIFAVLLTDTVLKTQRLNLQAAAYERQTLALFKQLFPDVKRVVNIRAQTKVRLNRAADESDTADFASLLRSVESKVRPLLDKQAMRLQSLRWQNRQLQLTVSAKQSATLQQLAEDLNQRFQAEFKLSHAAPDKTEGVIYVRAR
ncbi:type II secretion system protein GspL [Hydrogenovibrio thermophilus]|nr:type II secretion system protein GspL [Hydrogenovibrio thermophilus]